VPADGVHRIALPTPFQIGAVSCWLLDGDPLTLVDPGPRSAATRAALERGLAALGRRVQDVEQVVLTHQHHDHVGLAAEVRARSGARVAAVAPLARYLGAFEHSMDRNDAYACALMARHGIDAETAATLDGVSRSFRHFSGGVEVDEFLSPGGALTAGGRTFTVCARPGHSPTDTVFLDARAGLLVAGDHLLARIASNPVAHAPIDDRDPTAVAVDADRPRPLVDLVASLRATSTMDVATVLPGHGEPFAGHRELIERRIAGHMRRARRIPRAVDGRPTVSEIAARLWRDLPVTHAYVVLCEVLGHLDLLAADGRVREVERDGLAAWEVATAVRAAA
jgi:glyoxylase-like metal-dependent hydrolase (beta-lactamase superfamily II)